MKTTNMVPRELVCFGPKPKHLSLPVFERLVRQVIKDAEGIYKTRGMTCREIVAAAHRLAASHGVSAEAVSGFRIASALAKLHRRGIITNDGQPVRRWRMA